MRPVSERKGEGHMQGSRMVGGNGAPLLFIEMEQHEFIEWQPRLTAGGFLTATSQPLPLETWELHAAEETFRLEHLPTAASMSGLFAPARTGTTWLAALRRDGECTTIVGVGLARLAVDAIVREVKQGRAVIGGPRVLVS